MRGPWRTPPALSSSEGRTRGSPLIHRLQVRSPPFARGRHTPWRRYQLVAAMAHSTRDGPRSGCDMADNDGVNDGREAYRSDDIQGDVLPGFRRRDDDGFEQRFLLMRITGTADQARAGLRALLDRVSSGAAVDRSRDR